MIEKLIIPEGGSLFNTSSISLIWFNFCQRIELSFLILIKRSVSEPSFFSITREFFNPAKRGIQEFSYDISRVEKIQEVEIGNKLSLPFPQDYVSYVRLSRVDEYGVEHIIYPAKYTSQPSESILQDSDYQFLFDAGAVAVFGPGTKISEAAIEILNILID